ncbi:MAG: SBBP repeat-containing protein [Gemmatimonadaceae bacterium]|nr:SBBP repeat-containing protein [Gloeobacterales cyanobacterium ES-bin-141]
MLYSHIRQLAYTVLLSASLAASNFSGPLSPALALTPARPDAALEAQLSAAYGRLPLHFEANSGQTDSQVRFLARGKGYTLFLTPSQAVLSLRKGTTSGTAVRLEWLGANRSALIQGQAPIGGVSNYLRGKDQSRWQTNIQHYSKVQYRGVYPGIDLVYYGNQGQLEYDWVVAVKADPKRIKLRVEGAERIEINRAGELVLHTGGAEIRQHKPRVYQRVNGKNKAVAGRYVMLDKRTVGFALGKYDHGRELVIDPVLSYSTYLGGLDSNDQGDGIVVDRLGNAYIVGQATAVTFPTTVGAFQTTITSISDPLDYTPVDAFVTKLNPAGTALVYSTFLGGGESDFATEVAVDGEGNAYVTGTTLSPDFPTTANAFQTAFPTTTGTAFVTKLNATGSGLVYSTFLGGSDGTDGGNGNGIVVNGKGNAYVVGTTFTTNFPTTLNAFQTTNGGLRDVTVTKLSADGTALIYSTYLGGSESDIASDIELDGTGNAYVVGSSGSTDFPTTPGAFQTTSADQGAPFVTKLSTDGTGLVYSTYLGSGDILGVAIDREGNAYVTGATIALDFPTTPGAFQTTYSGGELDAFVAKLDATGTSLVYSTYLGGINFDVGVKLAVDGEGNAYVTGVTSSSNFPTTARAVQSTYRGGDYVYVTQLNATGTALSYSTYLGSGGGYSIALDNSGNAYVTGRTFSLDFPTTQRAFQTTASGGVCSDLPNSCSDAFVTKLKLDRRSR